MEVDKQGVILKAYPDPRLWPPTGACSHNASLTNARRTDLHDVELFARIADWNVTFSNNAVQIYVSPRFVATGKHIGWQDTLARGAGAPGFDRIDTMAHFTDAANLGTDDREEATAFYEIHVP